MACHLQSSCTSLMTYVVLIVFTLDRLAVSSFRTSTPHGAHASKAVQKNNISHIFLDELLKGMDNRIKPEPEDGGPVEVYCGLHIFSFSSINEISMDYRVSVFFRERWQDPRLSYHTDIGPPQISLSGVGPSRLWLPDIYFANEKDAKFHDVTVPNRMMKIYPNGTIIYSMRLTLVLSCPMDLTAFPMDTQICSIKLESYAYETHEVFLKWGRNPVHLDDELQLPQFDIKDIKTANCSKQYNTGNFSCLKVSFNLHRHFGFFLLQTYIPSILIVILSWVSFWINMDAVPARITLGVTTVLTMTTQLSGASSSLPKVSYPKAIDVWMSMCMIFVFAALVEYAFVNALSRKYTKDKYKKTEDVVDQVDFTANVENKHKAYPRIVHSLILGRLGTRNHARTVDKVSRIIFPMAFLIFNIIYWPVYMTGAQWVR